VGTSLQQFSEGIDAWELARRDLFKLFAEEGGDRHNNTCTVLLYSKKKSTSSEISTSM
jgi:hypothetical protein